MKTNNTKLSFSSASWRIGLAHLALVMALLIPQTSHAQKGIPLPACAKDLFDCAKDSAQVLGQSVLTVGNLLGAVVANGPCVAAMASGSPAAIGVTGLVLGLGAAGVVQPGSCEATFYGTALIPVTSALDAVLDLGLSSKTAGMGLDDAMFLMKKIPVPAVPGTIGELVNCGCGALDAGAKAVEDIRKVAKFATQAYESCGKAINSCPGLKEVVTVLKGAYQVITDPSSIVQSCDSMSRQQYVDARLRDLIIPVRDQFKNNVAWLGSDMDMNHLRPRLNTCFKYYDSHCYKEGDAKDFCLAAVYTEVLDPLLWGAIIEEYNGPQFDKFFAENVNKLAPAAVCPKDPGGTWVNLDPNSIPAKEQGRAAQSANAKACTQEMQALVYADSESMISLARGMLPTTREGWDADVRQKNTEKPLDNAKKLFLRVTTAAAVVTKAKMAIVSEKYKAQDTAVANSAEFAAVPYAVLNQQYGKWANIIVKAIDDSCPKDAAGWNGKHDLICVKELALAVGMSANEAANIKLDGVIVGAVAQSISNGSFKGSKYYNIASNIVLNGTPGAPPRIRAFPNTTEKETTWYMSRWPGAEAAATIAFAADLPALMGQQFARVAKDKAKRQEQEDIFAAMQRNNQIEAEYAGTVCDRLKTGGIPNALPMLCRSDINKSVSNESSKFPVSRAGAFLGVNNPAKPGPDAAFNKSVADIKFAHDQATKEYAAVHKQFGIESERIIMAGMVRAGSSGIIKVASTPQGSQAQGVLGATTTAGATSGSGSRGASASGAVLAGVTLGTGGKPPEATIKNDGAIGGKAIGQSVVSQSDKDKPAGAIIAAATPGQLSGVIASTPPKNVTSNSGAIGMPSAPTMGMIAINTAKAPPITNAAPANTSKAVGGASTVPSSSPSDIPKSIVNLLPFDATAYRKVREKQIEDEWFPKCAAQAQCLKTMDEITDKLLNTEIAALKAGTPSHTDKAAVEAFQNSLDPIFDPQFKEAMPKIAMAAQPPSAQAIVIASNSAAPPKNVAAMLPFDPAAYRRVREKEIKDEWMPKCGGASSCLKRMTDITENLLSREVTALTNGTPLHTDKAAVTAFQNSLDPTFDPQFKAAIPVTTYSTTQTGAGSISNKKPIDLKPKF